MFDINRYHQAHLGRHRPLVPPIVCADGFEFSVQASETHYCEPRDNYAWPYSSFEVGFPEMCGVKYAEPLLEPYSQQDGDSVFPWVPAGTINDIVHKHGGIRT